MSGNKKAYLEAHHIKSFISLLRKYKVKTLLQAIKCKELWDVNNGLTLCEKCHSLTDGYKGRKQFAKDKIIKKLAKRKLKLTTKKNAINNRRYN